LLKYSEICGADAKLHEIVVVGTHDAGITGGAANVRTQDLDIYGQASAGVRVFDIRIAADRKHGDRLKTYHGAKIAPEKKSIRGAFGEALNHILIDAESFVSKGEGTAEFLILKFDKCSNWAGIADACQFHIGTRLLAGEPNVNRMTLGDLAGHVVVVFSDEGWKEARAQGANVKGIHKFANLKNGADYNDEMDGIQYYGKGGTSIWKPFGKIGQNKATQKKLMRKAAGSMDPEVLGMMYWTSTGIFESIRDRDARMWKDKRKPALQRLWNQGLGQAVVDAMPGHLDPADYAAGPEIKRFMPNIVMIDFANEERCELIAGLNTAAATALTQAAQGAQREEI